MENNNYRRAGRAMWSAGWLLLQILGSPAWAVFTLDNSPLKARIESVHQDSAAAPAAGPISSDRILPALYEQSGYAPVWSNPLSVQQLLEAIRNSTRHGLDPRDYHLDTLELLLNSDRVRGHGEHERIAHLDLLLSDSLARLGSHLARGRIDLTLPGGPLADAPDPQLSRLAMQAVQYVSSGRVDEWLQGMAPQTEHYRRLGTALARYRHYRQLGGWQAIPDGAELTTGRVDARVPLLRARLIATGDLGVQDMYFSTFDDALRAGVMRFQRRHGLDDDGVVGKRTLAALNVPVARRIEQIIANMERERGRPEPAGDRYIMVDIAGLHVHYVRDGATLWQGRAIVGRPQRKSPLLDSRITHLELNPSWTVPPTVLGKDVLPELRRDPDWLRERDMEVVDYAGTRVDSARIDWSRYSGRSFPWLIRQAPGSDNALGRIKFMFPNEHAVYLHDTPARNLFQQTERALSSGCIRIEKPLELATLLLQDTPGWDSARLERAIDSRATRSVSLANPVDIHLQYRTVAVETDGTVSFRPDIYGYDEPLIQALREYRPADIPAGWQNARSR